MARSEPQAAPPVPPATPAGAQVYPSPAHRPGLPPTQLSAEPAPVPAPLPPKDESRSAWGWVNFILVFSLAACLFAWLGAAFALDLFSPEPTPIAAPQITPAPQVVGLAPTAAPDQRALKIGLTPDGRFGLTAQGTGLPASVQGKQLTFSPIGETSNTRLWLDGQTPLFGRDGRLSQFDFHPDAISQVDWEYGAVRVTQTLETVLGESGLGDTVRIRYQLTNLDQQEHQVGLRIMVDTLIGENDGVPFLVPGLEGITDHAVDLKGADVPDSIRALEVPDLVNPGVIANLSLRGGDATLPDRVLITGWYHSDMEWDFLQGAGGIGAPLKRGGLESETPDSAVGLFYDPQPLAPGASRTILVYYGLGSISSTSTGNRKLGLFAPASVNEGDKFYLTAVIADPSSGETISLALPENLALAPGESAMRPLEASSAGFTQVSWLLQACRRGDNVQLEARVEPGGVSEFWTIDIQPVGITRPGGACP